MRKYSCIALIILLFSTNLFLGAYAWREGDSESIKSKFEPWLWDKVQRLDANGTTRFMVTGVSIICSSYEHNVTAAYNFKTQVANLLAQDHNVNALKGERVTFTFWFLPKSASPENYTRAEIYYINGTWVETSQAHINGTQVPLTETEWNSASVTATLPDDTLAIKVIIHGQPTFIAWIDNKPISIQS